MSDTARIISPVDGRVYAERPFASMRAAEQAVDRAVEAQRHWRSLALGERIRLLERAVFLLGEEAGEVSEELAWQMGRPVSQGGGEVNGFTDRAHTMLELAPSALAPLERPDKAGFKRYIRREPVGVVLTIAPWNFPYMTAVNSVWPALAAGNTVLLKHARQTLLSAERLQRVLERAGVPDGVFQALPMTHETTAALLSASAIRYVSFTGSVRGGRELQKAVARHGHFTGLGLELGGKDPAYVRADADIADAAANLADGAFFNAGQSCCSVERLYVHRDVHDDFVEALVAEAYRLRLGDPLDAATTLGPMVGAEAAAFARAQVHDAVEAGATALIDPKRFTLDQPGTAYMAPQILIGVDHGMRVMTEESFAPLVGVMPVASDDEAVRLMNDSEFGLSASIWTTDLDAAERLGDRIHTGTLFMNRCDALDPMLAWTGIKNSGRGVSLSELGFDALTQPKSFHLRLPPGA